MGLKWYRKTKRQETILAPYEQMIRDFLCPPAIQALADAYAGKTYDDGAVAAGIADGTVKIVVCGDGEALFS